VGWIRRVQKGIQQGGLEEEHEI